MAPFMPLGPGVSTISAPKLEQHTALDGHRLRHGENELVALDGGDERPARCRYCAGGLDENRLAGLDLAGLLGGVDHREADAVFHAGQRVAALQLGDDGGRQPGGQAVQLDQRRASDKFCDIRGNARP